MLGRALSISLVLALTSAALGAECPAADPNDELPDDAALQACLDKGGAVELAAGSPGYVLKTGLVLRKSGTTLSGKAPRPRPRRPKPGEDGGEEAADSFKPTILAAPDFGGTLLKAPAGVNDYVVSGIIFDGNAERRTRAADCKDGGPLGPNLSFEGGGFTVRQVSSVRALCGSAMIVLGRGFKLHDNMIADNGRSGDQAPGISAPWADGMTVLLCDNGSIYRNAFIDNTDIALVLGGGPNCRVHENTFVQARKHAFAALNVGNFNDNGRHTGSIYESNRIRAEKDMLVWGLLLGSHPWSQKVQVFDAGLVRKNAISGAMVNLAIDGIQAGVVEKNTLSRPSGSYGYGTPRPRSPEGCRKRANYTAGDYGSARLQRGFIPRVYHDGQCPDIVAARGGGSDTSEQGSPAR